jgi:hypothetical protein
LLNVKVATEIRIPMPDMFSKDRVDWCPSRKPLVLLGFSGLAALASTRVRITA